jgi:hypothetical protein
MNDDFQIDMGDLYPEYPLSDEYERDDENLCLECGRDEAQIEAHCFDCWGSMICEELGLPERLVA